MAFIKFDNGRRVNIPDSGVYGSDIIREMKPRPGRRPVIHSGGTKFTTIDPSQKYSKRELIDKKGQPVKVTTIPDRTKGAFGGERTQLSKQIITEQVYDIAQHLFKDGVDFDEDEANWLVVPHYRLPAIWRDIARDTPLLITFPTEYPERPPVGFYLMADLPCSPNGHLYEQAYHEADKTPLAQHWKWYCVYIQPGAWNPAPVRRPGDWKHGDNLWQYFTLINEALSSQND